MARGSGRCEVAVSWGMRTSLPCDACRESSGLGIAMLIFGLVTRQCNLTTVSNIAVLGCARTNSIERTVIAGGSAAWVVLHLGTASKAHHRGAPGLGAGTRGVAPR